MYGVLGFRTQPFGAFFPRLVTDPVTQDAYEVKKVGATLGWKPGPWDLDLSATAYRGEEQMAHLFVSGLFDSASVVRSTDAGLRAEADDVGSWILAATLSPLKDLVAGAAFVSEPGDGRRNQTLALWGARRRKSSSPARSGGSAMSSRARGRGCDDPSRRRWSRSGSATT